MFGSILNMSWILNMLGLHKVVNKIFRHRYSAWFWICLKFWKYQCYTEFCRKQNACLTGFWVFLELSLCQGLNIQGSWIWQGCTCFYVNCILKIVSILNILSSEYAKVLNVSGVYIHYPEGFWIKYLMVYIWQVSEYTTVSKNARVLNISGSLIKPYII